MQRSLIVVVLVLAFACLGAYTLMVGMEHGWNFLPLFFGGMMLLAPYLLWASTQANGSAAILLLGKKRSGC